MGSQTLPILPVFINQRISTISNSCSESGGKLSTCGQVKERIWETRHKPCVLILSKQRQGMTEPQNILRWKRPTRIIESNRRKLIKALSTVRNPRLQNHFPKKVKEESPRAQPFKPQKCCHSLAEKMPSSRGEELELFTFCLLSVQKFYKLSTTTTQWDFEGTPQKTTCATNRARGYHIIFRTSTAHICGLETLQKVLLFHRDGETKSFLPFLSYLCIAFHLKQFLHSPKSSCISPKTVTIGELKPLHTTDPRQCLITIISSD